MHHAISKYKYFVKRVSIMGSILLEEVAIL